jgi:hypothetical protein
MVKKNQKGNTTTEFKIENGNFIMKMVQLNPKRDIIIESLGNQSNIMKMGKLQMKSNTKIEQNIQRIQQHIMTTEE